MNKHGGGGLSNSGVELLKWLALVGMLVDHVNAVFFARELGTVADAIGRVAFPLFAFVLAYNLARPRADWLRSLRRLLGFGLLAQVPFIAAFQFGYLPLNILFTFAAAVLVGLLARSGHRLVALGVFLGAGVVVEYAWAGIALVVVIGYVLRVGLDASRAVLLVIALAALCVWNGNGWALLAVPLVFAARYWSPELARSRRGFWWFYPLHLAALALVASVFPVLGQ